MNEAMLYECLDHSVVRCNLCNHGCKIQEDKLGICGVRQNQGGSLYSLVYGKIIAEHVDPIEKKPLFNFFPAQQPIHWERWAATSAASIVRTSTSPNTPVRIEGKFAESIEPPGRLLRRQKPPVVE